MWFRVCFVAVVLHLGCSAWAQDTGVLRLPGPPPLALPAWLAPFPEARGTTGNSTPSEATSSYKALIPPPAIVAHYEGQLRAAGIRFETRPEGSGAVIEATAERHSGTVRIHGEDGVTRVEVSYGPRREPPAPAEPAFTPLRLEWPAWLQVPRGRLVSQRTNPAGHIGRGIEDTCPGDILNEPSHGCIERVYESTGQLAELYHYFDDALTQHGFATRGPGAEPDAYADLGQFIAPPLASLNEREYPAPHDENYYQQLNIFLRQVQTPTTKVEIAFLARNPPGVEGAATWSVSGFWAFTHELGRFTGVITLRQVGDVVTGTWHTETGKSEPDTPVAGQVDGRHLFLTRSMGNLRQEYVLTVSADGDQIDGYGDGWGLMHGNLNLRRRGVSRQ
jgi:hypothetical protein